MMYMSIPRIHGVSDDRRGHVSGATSRNQERSRTTRQTETDEKGKAMHTFDRPECKNHISKAS